MRLVDLRNIGSVSEERLTAVGIRTPEELESVGALEAYRRVKEAFPRETTLIWYYALQGALLDVNWNELPRDMISRLKQEAREI